jgi:FkbM family methyltransferase
MRRVRLPYPFARGRYRVSNMLTRLFPVPDGAIVATRNGLEMELRPVDDSVSRQLYWFGDFEPNETRFLLRTLHDGMHAIDVGAHIGTHTLLMAEAVGPTGRVLSFEPESRNATLLQRNVDRNGFSERVTVTRAAAADEVRDVRLILERGATNWIDVGSQTARKADVVRCTTLDVAVQQAGLARVDLVKTDTEGAELLVLRGAEKTLSNFRPVLVVESAARYLARYGTTPHELVGHLTLRGYRPFLATRRSIRSLSPDDDLSDVNVIFLPD